MNYFDLFFDIPVVLRAIGIVMIMLALGFLIWFLIPAILLRLKLAGVLRKIQKSSPSSVHDLEKLFSKDLSLLHLWKEFSETLHSQREERDGQMVVMALRATAPAEVYFNSQYVVDGRLRTEFFKHLPGLFTGIGIIGTFMGLITGLREFEVPEDPARVRQSLDLLLTGVFEAFIVSAAAITLAMVVTFFEKILLSSLYRCTENIAQYLDTLFMQGAGEEYLSRLVTASEDSAAQSKILKDSLVGDMKLLLQEITDRQIAAQKENAGTMAREIVVGIETGLKQPLDQLGELVKKASGDQSAVASTLLTDVMASFSQRLNDLFGGQISGIQELNQKSAQAMQDAVASLQGLLGRMEMDSQRSGEVMAERMANAIEEMQRRQAEINEQTLAFVEMIRDIVSKSQTETNTNLNDAVASLSQQMVAMIAALQAQAKMSHQAQQDREKDHTERTTGMVSDLGASVAEVVRSMAESTGQMRKSVEVLERTTTDAIDKLNTGAQVIERGAIAFSQAGEKVTGALNGASVVANKMVEVSGSLSSSSTALQSVLGDYRANREATASMLADLRAVVESAKKEASLTQEALHRINSAAEKLANAQKESENYLENISEVLATAHSSFSEGLTRTLDRANADFHAKLSTSVKLLASAIEELEVTLSGTNSTGSRR